MSSDEKEGTQSQQPRTTDSGGTQQSSEIAPARPQEQSQRNQCRECAQYYLQKTKEAALWVFGPITWLRRLPPIDKFTFIVALFTALLAIATCVQVYAFIQSERAFIGPNAPRIADGELVPDKRLTLIFQFVNTGKSTALIKQINVSTATIPSTGGLPPKPIYLATPSVGRGPVPSQGNKFVTWSEGDEGPFFMSAAIVEELKDGKRKFYVWGFVRYTDEFQWFGSRISGYCYIYLPKNRSGLSPFQECDSDEYIYAH